MDEKNPFSIYDFLGYLFPGSLALFILYVICKVDASVDNVLPFSYVESFMGFLRDKNTEIDIWKVGLPFIVVAYILGHLFSYLSSITVEYMTNRAFGYPSKYLLSHDDINTHNNYWSGNTDHQLIALKEHWYRFIVNPFIHFWNTIIYQFCNIKSAYFWVRTVIFFCLLPISLLILSSSKITRLLIIFVTKPLDQYFINCIEAKIFHLPENIELLKPPINLQCDFHRIIMHYVYLNIPGSRRKIDNYITLYGFLRATALILSLFTVFISYIGIRSIFININNVDSTINWASVFLVIGCWLSTIVCYLGFVKFYRRFTLENFMSLLTGKENEDIEQS